MSIEEFISSRFQKDIFVYCNCTMPTILHKDPNDGDTFCNGCSKSFIDRQAEFELEIPKMRNDFKKVVDDHKLAESAAASARKASSSSGAGTTSKPPDFMSASVLKLAVKLDDVITAKPDVWAEAHKSHAIGITAKEALTTFALLYNTLSDDADGKLIKTKMLDLVRGTGTDRDDDEWPKNNAKTVIENLIKLQEHKDKLDQL